MGDSNEALTAAVREYHFQLVLILQELGDDLTAAVDKRDKLRALADSLELLYPELTSGDTE